MKILVFLEHDIIIRHFIHSGVFRRLTEKHDVTFIFPDKGHKRVKTDITTLNLNGPYRHLIVNNERQKLWAHLFFANILRYRFGKQYAALRRFFRIANGARSSLLHSVLALPLIFSVFRHFCLRKLSRLPNNDLNNLLDMEQPDIIVHPCILSGLFINDIIGAAKERAIPSIVIMNSWDNPSMKQAMIGSPDWLLVWGEQTKRHAIEYMKMPEDRIVKIGVAQFDVYRQQPRLSRQEFCGNHGIDPSSKVLLYAGSSKNTDEFQHLIEIDQAIISGKLANTFVVYRPHPWGGGGIGGERILNHDWVNIRIEESMREYLESVTAGSAPMYMADYRHTHDVLSSVDAVISPLSTILIEGALHGKPVLCFLPEDEAVSTHYNTTHPLVHFDDMFRMPEFLIAEGKRQLIPKLEELLERASDNDSLDSLRRACRFFVEPFDEPYGERLMELIEDVADQP